MMRRSPHGPIPCSLACRPPPPVILPESSPHVINICYNPSQLALSRLPFRYADGVQFHLDEYPAPQSCKPFLPVPEMP